MSRHINRPRLADVKIIIVDIVVIMAALRSRCGRYIFVLWFLLVSFYFFLSFSSPNLSRRRSDVYLPYFLSANLDKNSSGDEIANVHFYAVRPEATRIRLNNAK